MVFKVLLILLYILNIVTVFTVLFSERKDPRSTIAWLLVLIFIPGIGLLFYLFFGRGFKIGVKKRLRAKEELNKKYNTPEFKEHLNFMIKEHASGSESCESYNKLIKLNFSNTKGIYSNDNMMELYITGEDKYRALFEDIRNAKESINIIYFIIENNGIGKEFVRLLTQKACEGVEVRLMYDDIGSFTTPFTMFHKLKKAGGKVKKFSPLILGSLLYANYRNHRKIVVIDGIISYSGGMNIGDSYIGKHKRARPWRDTHYKIIGSATHSFQLIFFLDWFYITNDADELAGNLTLKNFPLIRSGGNCGLQVVPGGPDTEKESIKRGIISMIYEARKYVYIQTPYFVPDEAMLEAIQNVSAAGVEVSVMIPTVPDHPEVHAVTVSFIEPLISYGVNVYCYEGFIHAKMVVVDGIMGTIGTTNFDIRSFSLHFEVNTFVYDEDVAKRMGEIFDRDRADSKLVNAYAYENRSRVQRFKESIFRLMSPLF